MIIPLIIITVIALYVVSFYNKLRTTKVRIKASIQEIGNQLKRQSSLIPNLVSSVKGFMKQEKGIFKDLTDARKLIETNNLKNLDKSQDLINKALNSIKVIVESNPEIKSQELVSNLMNELRDTADKLMYSRRTLIDLSADYNTAISVIPGIWFASIFGFKEEKGLETPTSGQHLSVSATDTQTPEVKLN
ncbi:LemA family protein [Patescibacteria group bacterium]|nr:LemA family protein [Patescibacteria group bacterium]